MNDRPDLETWMDQTVSWNNIEFISRRTAIVRLCINGLVPFVQTNGYHFNIFPQDLYKRIGKGLYLNQNISTVGSRWPDEAVKNTCTLDEHKNHFYHVLDSEKWESFWKKWGAWSDVSLESEYGWDRQNDIQEYMWTLLDLDLSPQTQVVNELLGLVDENTFEELDNRDHYLKDMAESNEWGGQRR